MSSLSFLFVVSPTPTLQSRCGFLTPSRAELCRYNRGCKLGVIRGEKDSRVSRPGDRVAAKAGLGRYSGAVHGASTQRGRRRRPSLRPDECDENSSSNENDSAMQRQEDTMDRPYEGSGMDGVIHDDGEPVRDFADSHQRYLSELGIVEDDVGREYQLHEITDASTWVPIGMEGDLGYQQVNTVAVNSNGEDENKGANGAWEGGSQVLPVTDVDRSEKDESKKDEKSNVTRGKKVRRNKVDFSESTGYLAEVESVAASVSSNPELSLEQSFEVADANGNSVTNQGNVKPDSDILPTESGYLQDMPVLPTPEISGKSRKHRRRIKKKLGMNSAVTTKLPHDESLVRIVEGEAEQPSSAEILSSSQRGRRVKGDDDAGIVSTNLELQTTMMTVTGPEEREGSGRAEDICEAHGTGTGAEECVTVSGISLEESAHQCASGGALSDSIMDSVGGSKDSCGASSHLEIERFVEEGGGRSELPNTEVKNEVVKTGAEVDSEDAVENPQVGIATKANIAGSMNPETATLDSRSSLESMDDEYGSTNSLTKRKEPAVMAMAIAAENVSSAEALILSNPVMEQAVQVVSKVAELPAQVASKVVELPTQVASKVVEIPTQIASKVVELPTQVASKVAELPAQVANKVVDLPGAVMEQATQVGTLVVEQVAEILPDAVTEQVGQVVSQVVDLRTQFSDQVSLVADQVLHVGQMMVDQVAEAGESVVDQVSTTAEQVVQAAESVTSTANQVVEQVTEKVTDMLSFDEDDESDSDDEFEAYQTTDDPAFRGSRGLQNFLILQEDQGVLARIYDFYTYMLKQPLPKFSAAMFSAPIIVSLLFTLLYLPEYKGLAFDDTARDFFGATYGDAVTLEMSWGTVFQVFMFSLSLSTGLQPELAPLSPYTLIVANINALVAQLVFVFLSGAVFARLSQPAQPVRCSTVALVSTSPAQRKRKENAIKVLMARYVLAGPQPCELVDVKVDLSYKYNTITRTGSYFRATQSLKLVRPEIAFLTHGMLVRHVIDSTSPLYQRTSEMLKKEDAVFILSVVGLERSSMQSIFHVQHYCVCDDDVIWDAEFEDLILINSKKNRRIVDHTRLSMWKSIQA